LWSRGKVGFKYLKKKFHTYIYFVMFDLRVENKRVEKTNKE